MVMPQRKIFLPLLGAAGFVVFLAGCTVGPKYERATAPTTAKWEVSEPWRQSDPKDAVPKGEWWSIFHDDELNDLEKEALAANQTLQAATGNYHQARAAAAIQVATNFPTLGVSPSAERQRLSGNRPTNGAVVSLKPVTQSTYTLPFTAGYEVDLFGQRRRSIEAAEASYQASAANLENVRLVITAELAGDYFTLRQLDSELGILNRTVDTLRRGLELVDSRHKGGVASGLDVAQEETLLQTTRTQATLLLQQRKQFEDAIAVLVGRPAPDFHIPTKELNGEPPPIDLGLPSDLLERRPDIAQAERQMAVANAEIGVAKAAYYPVVNLAASGGFESSVITTLINGPSGLWSIGLSAVGTVFDGGRRRALNDEARAAYDGQVAVYREDVLTGFQQVEDNLAAVRILENEAKVQDEAVVAAERSLDLSVTRYKGGVTSYLEVITAQSAALSDEVTAVNILGRRMANTVLLIQALGGGWDRSSLPERPECCGKLVSTNVK